MMNSVAESEHRGVRRRWLLLLLKWFLFGVVLFLVGRALLGHLRRADWSAVTFRPGLGALSAVCLLAVFGVQMLSYRSLLGAFVPPLPWRGVIVVTWVPLLGKYVPGKVAAIATAVFLLRRWRVSASVTLSVLLILDGLAVLSGLTLGSPLLLTSGVAQIVPGGGLLTLAVVAGGIICIHPAVFDRLVNAALRLLHRPPLPRMPTLRDYAVPAACAFGQWALCGAALWFMSAAVVPGLKLALLPTFICIAALAMTASYLAVFAPGGLGVREGVFLVTLTPSLGATAAAVTVVAMRILTIGVEILLFSIGAVLLKQVQRERIQDDGPCPPHQPSLPRSADSDPA